MTLIGDVPNLRSISELLAAFAPDQLEALLRNANQRYAYHAEFESRVSTLDANVREEAWSLLDFSRRVTAHQITTVATGSPWFTPTPEIIRLLHEIDIMVCGHLSAALARLGDEQQRFASQALMDEAVAACLAPDEQSQMKDVRSFLRHGLEPRTRTERLVTNFYLTMLRIPAMARSPITLDTIIELQRLLSDGLCDSEEQCTAFRRRNIPRRTIVDRWPGAVTPPLASEVLPTLQRLTASTEGARPWVHPLIEGPLIYFSLVNLRPFEISEIGLSRAVFQMHMHRAGYPALQLMPISQVLLQRYRDYGKNWPAENRGDLTGFVIWALESIWDAVDALRRSIDARVAENERLREQLRFDQSLNNRQRTILGRALRLPGATFFIDYHRRSYGIAYSTARADLTQLVDRGYMRVRREGHAFVFTAAPGLRERVTGKTGRV